jgi:MinD-like ATPase involved in chromosome partitioning or flagellar assembly
LSIRIKHACPELLDLFLQAPLFTPPSMKAADQNQNAANTPAAMAELFSVPYFGKVPMDPNMMFACENGFSFLEKFPNSPASGPFSAIVDKLIASAERNTAI